MVEIANKDKHRIDLRSKKLSLQSPLDVIMQKTRRSIRALELTSERSYVTWSPAESSAEQCSSTYFRERRFTLSDEHAQWD